MATEGKKHAKYSASSAHRWMSCPGSIKLSEKAPPPRESAYSKEGTEAHSWLEKMLRSKTPGSVRAELEKQNAQMASHVWSAHQWVMKNKPKGAELLVEYKSTLDHLVKDAGGTADIVFVDLFETLHVIDFKYGAGVVVEPEYNQQLLIYALGVAHKHDYNFERVKLTIIQPRAYHEQGTVRTWECEIGFLKEFAEGVAEAVYATQAQNPPLLPAPPEGENYCRFCPANVICPELSSKALKQAKVDFEPVTGELSLPSPQGLSNEDLGQALCAFPKIETWIEEIRKLALHRSQSGVKVPGWKTVAKRGTRQWINPRAMAARARKMFGVAAFTPPELLSPAQFEKLDSSAEKLVAKNAVVVSSGVTLAPESDPREACSLAQVDFEPVSTISKG